MATRPRRPPVHPPGSGGDGLTHHSHAGSQYTSLKLTEHLALEDIRPSIGTVGDAYDNALMETINGLDKAECIQTTVFLDGPYKSLADVEYATAGWVDWYNQRRLHGSLGNVPPVEYEHATTLPSTESRNPYENGKEPGALQDGTSARTTSATYLSEGWGHHGDHDLAVDTDLDAQYAALVNMVPKTSSQRRRPPPPAATEHQ